MIEILLCSDLHTNFHRDGAKSAIKSLYEKDIDVAVIAGDLSILRHHLIICENLIKRWSHAPSTAENCSR